jgi:TP901 family phage tail tape measure protein
LNIGVLTATLGVDAQSAINSMTHFERVIITLVNKIDSTLERMEASMAGVTGAALDMRNKSVAGFTATANAAKVATVATQQYTTAVVAAKTASGGSAVGGKLPLTSNIKNSLAESTHMMSTAAAYGVPEKVYRDSINQQIAYNKTAAKTIADRNKMIKSANVEADNLMKQYYVNEGKRIKTQAYQYADNATKTIAQRDRMINAANKEADSMMKAYQKAATSNKFSLDSVTSSLNNVSQKFRTFGYLTSATVTLPMVMAGKSAFNMAKDYEFSIQKIVGLTGVAQSEVNKWNKELLAMSPTVAKGPKELADALYFISSSGIKGAEALNVLKLSAKAASAGLGDTKEVADLLTSALNAYRGTGLTASYAMDVLVAAVREGKAEASGFSSAMGQIIPIASQLGVSFDQVAGGMAAITLTGSSSSQAAVYLKGVFNSLLKATTQGETALQKTGNSYAGLRKILGEQGVIPLMQRLRDIQVKYGDELLSDVLPNIRALTGYLSLAGKNFKYNTDLMNRVTNAGGSLAKAFAAVSDTIKFKYDSAISAAQVSLISLGKSVAVSFLPILDRLVQKLEKTTLWFNSLSDVQKENKLKWAAFIALLGPASLLISVLGYGISGIIKGFGVLGKLISIVNIGLDAMGFRILKLGTLKLGNLKSSLLSILGFLGESGAAAMIGGVGVAVGGATIAITKYAKKVKELAKEHDLYYTTLVNVNGELKKLKDLTGTDVESMTKPQVAVAMDQVRKAWIAAEAGWKQAEKNKGLGWKINQKENLKQQVEYAKQIAEYSKLYNEMTNAYLLGDISKFDTLQKKLTQITTDTAKMQEITDSIKDEIKYTDAFAPIMKSLGIEYNTTKIKQEILLEGIKKYLKEGVSVEDKKVQDLMLSYQKLNNEIKKAPISQLNDPFGFDKLKQPATTSSFAWEDYFSEEEYGKYNKFTEQLQNDLDIIANKEKVLGASYNSSKAYLNAYSNAYTYLLENFAAGNPVIDEAIKKYMTLAQTMETSFFKEETINRLTDAFTNFFSITKEGFQDFGKYVEDWAWSVLQSFENLLAGMLAKKIIETLFPTEKIKLITAATNLLTTAEKVKATTTAATIPITLAAASAETVKAEASTAAAVAGAASSTAWIPIVGVGLAVAGIAALVIAMKRANATKMAEGGIIPSGYPNDTYPALLSSGETVLPKALSGITMQNDSTPKEVLIRFQNGSLEGYLNYQKRKSNSFK